jgi:pimeloyl-ACP methyl ester carboxylesterase
VLKPPILLVHGMWSTPATFDGLRPVLEAAGHATHAPALPFHDRPASLPPAPELGSLSITAYVDFIVAEAGKLGAPPVLVGHSMGCVVVQLAASRIPHAGIVLLAPAAAANAQAFSLDPVRTLKSVLTRWGWWDSPTLLDEAGARWGVMNGVPDADADQEVKRLVWDSGRVMAEMALPPLFGNVTRVDYARLDQPALVIVGSEDRTTPPGIARATARNLGGRVDYHELPGMPHWLFWGDVERQMATLVTEWLASLA